MKNAQDLKIFLQALPLQKDISLMVAETKEQMDELVEELAQRGFRQAIDSGELMKRIKNQTRVYIVIRDTLPKAIRDVIIQYATGQIELFNREKMQSEIIKPEYDKTALVIVTTSNQVRNMQQEGFNLLENVGLTYRS